MNMAVDCFIEKVVTEAPDSVTVIIQNTQYSFLKTDENQSDNTLIQYDATTNEGQRIRLDIRHAHKPGTPFNRFEIHSPGKSAQITCFHFGKLGFTKGIPVIDINQSVKLSGRDRKANITKKELAMSLLRDENLMDTEDQNKWYLGTYNTNHKDWAFGRKTSEFIADFLKIGLIMAHVRGDRGIILEGCKTS